jgi:hypothetical protein
MFMGVDRDSFWKGFLTFIKITLFSLSALRGCLSTHGNAEKPHLNGLFGP